jgi:small subunit ribosomal protein S16
LLKIRLRRVGAPKKPSYRVVIARSQAPRDGAFIEIIGHFNPLTDPETFDIDADKAKDWLAKGAQPTETTARLLVKAGIIEKPVPKKEKPVAKKASPSKKRASPTKEKSSPTKEKP